VEKLAGGFVFTEGPAADRQGNVYFSDIPNNRIHRYGADGKLTTFRDDSGAANGLYFDDKGNLIACQGGARRLAAFDTACKETVWPTSTIANVQQPQRSVDRSQGGILQRPHYGNMQGLEQDGFHVVLVARSQTLRE
jgi:gluconolactonase